MPRRDFAEPISDSIKRRALTKRDSVDAGHPYCSEGKFTWNLALPNAGGERWVPSLSDPLQRPVTLQALALYARAL